MLQPSASPVKDVSAVLLTKGLANGAKRRRPPVLPENEQIQNASAIRNRDQLQSSPDFFITTCRTANPRVSDCLGRDRACTGGQFPENMLGCLQRRTGVVRFTPRSQSVS